MTRKLITINLLTSFLILVSSSLMAQKDTTSLKKEVEVTKAFQPTILEAVKINDIPKIKTEPAEAPTFDYSIYSKPVFSTADVKPIAAAKMVGEEKPELSKGLLKLGFGNYLTPYGELFYNVQPGKKSNFGMHFSHLSSGGKIDLLNGDKVKAPESENGIELFGKQFFNHSTLSGSLAYDRKAFTYYGYAGDKLTDAEKNLIIPLWGGSQYFSKGTFDVHLKNETLSAYDFTYDFGINCHLLKTKTGQTENQFVLSGEMTKKVGNALGSLDASLNYYKSDSVQIAPSNMFGFDRQLILRANPSVTWRTKNSSLQVGLNSTISFEKGKSVNIMVYPKVKADWSPVQNVLTLFAGVDSYLQQNTYSSVATENPYVDPYHNLKNTLFQYVLNGGIKGKLTSKTNFLAEAKYSVIKDQHFYYTWGVDLTKPASSGRRLTNTFPVIYDDVNILKLSAELLHSVSEDFSIHLLGNYYSYDLASLSKAWQMPNFDITLSGIFRPTERLKFTTDIFVIGKRTALIEDFDALFSFSSLAPKPTEKSVTMDPIIDLNAGLEYQFSSKLNFFTKLNNFGFRKYEQWLGYTNKSFNWLAGISYSF